MSALRPDMLTIHALTPLLHGQAYAKSLDKVFLIGVPAGALASLFSLWVACTISLDDRNADLKNLC